MTRMTPAERTVAAQVRAVEETRVWPRVNRRGPDECWPWLAGTNQKGYGVLAVGTGADRHQIRAHTAVYILLVGEPPEGLVPDHVRCGNPGCVNPAHLEWVTNGENVLRGDGPTARNARKTRCAHGHPFDETNTYWHLRGGNLVRGCRACRAAIDRVAKDRKTAKRHRRDRCDRGHDWETNKRVSRAGRVYCHLCRVETGRMGRG